MFALSHKVLFYQINGLISKSDSKDTEIKTLVHHY